MNNRVTKAQVEEVLSGLYLIAGFMAHGWFAVVLFVMAGLNCLSAILVAILAMTGQVSDG